MNEMQYGRVTAKELVEAVHEMLSAAGINMELENRSLLQRTITLQEELKDSKVAFLLEQVRLQSNPPYLKTQIMIIMMKSKLRPSLFFPFFFLLAGESRGFHEGSRDGEITMGV